MLHHQTELLTPQGWKLASHFIRNTPAVVVNENLHLSMGKVDFVSADVKPLVHVTAPTFDFCIRGEVPYIGRTDILTSVPVFDLKHALRESNGVHGHIPNAFKQNAMMVGTDGLTRYLLGLRRREHDRLQIPLATANERRLFSQYADAVEHTLVKPDSDSGLVIAHMNRPGKPEFPYIGSAQSSKMTRLVLDCYGRPLGRQEYRIDHATAFEADLIQYIGLLSGWRSTLYRGGSISLIPALKQPWLKTQSNCVATEAIDRCFQVHTDAEYVLTRYNNSITMQKANE